MTLEDKERSLHKFLRRYKSAVVAFSGGVDSSYLAYAANQVMGDAARAVTALSPSVSELQKNLVREFVAAFKLNHCFVDTAEIENPDYTANPTDRCYFCKSELFSRLGVLREEWGVDVIFDGSNADDVGDYRPGRKATGTGSFWTRSTAAASTVAISASTWSPSFRARSARCRRVRSIRRERTSSLRQRRTPGCR